MSAIRTPNPNYEDANRAFVAEVAFRRGVTLGHLRNDGGCELCEIMRKLDAALGSKPPVDETNEVYDKIGVLRPDGEFTTYEGCDGDPVYIRRTLKANALLPHLDTCQLKYGGQKCSCGLAEEPR